MTKRWNRNLGAVGGLVSGLLVALILLFLVDALYKAFPRADNAFARAAGGSAFRGWASEHNPADRFLLTDSLKLLRKARKEPEVVERLSEDPRVQALLQHPTIQAVAEDKELAEAIRKKQIGRVLKDEQFQALLRDPELLQKVLSPSVRDAVREALEKEKQEESEGQGEEP